MTQIKFSENAWEDYLYFQATDRKLLPRLNRLIEEASRDPAAGIGRPERLRGNLSGWWSRRLTDEHRLVYRRNGDVLEIAACRSHYE